MKTYVTVQGDTWDAIAFKAMGSTRRTGELMRKNRQFLSIYLFPAGVELVVPEEKRTLNSDLPPWKQGVG